MTIPTDVIPVVRHERPLLVCLLPARNAAGDLPGYFASVERCCDAIVALDDGSTDNTLELLEQHPLVNTVLRNPPRTEYTGWDDAVNRNRLLTAALELDPVWLISLDADERLDQSDARSLRRFLETDALPGCAYGFRHVPMHQDGEHFLPKYHWMFRLFSAAPDQRFPSQKLHFAPIPTSIPRDRWLQTSLRIQHFGELTAGHRLRRFHKYLLTDPSRRYQGDYAQLLAPGPPPDDLRRWQPRPDSIPVLMEQVGSASLTPTEGSPALSVIVFAYNAAATISRTLTAVLRQVVTESFEVIVVVSGDDQTSTIVRDWFPEVTLIDLGRRALPGAARNAGLAAALGAFIVFTEAHVVPCPGNLAARLDAHRRGYGMVTGLMTNGTATPTGWASYFLDHAEKLPGQAAAEFHGPPGRCSYARLPLLEVGGFPEDMRTGEDTVVNRSLVQRGYVAYRDPAVRLIHYSRCTTLPKLLHHHFRRGRGWGRIETAAAWKRGVLLDRAAFQRLGPRAISRRLQQIEAGVAQADPGLSAHYWRQRRLVRLGAIATWTGMWLELLRPASGKWALLLGRPVLNVLVVESDSVRIQTLVQLDARTGAITSQPVALGVKVVAHGQLVELSELIRDLSGATLRQAVREALGAPTIECIVLPENLLGDSGPVLASTSLPAQIRERVRLMAMALIAYRRETLRSTLPWWRTLSVLTRLRS